MKTIFILSPVSLEHGRGGEISSMELALGLNQFYNITFADTNRDLGKKLIPREDINKKLKGIKRIHHLNFATAKIFNKNFDIIYPWEFIRLYRLIKKCDVVYTSISNFKISFMFMILSIINRKSKFIIGYRRPLYSNKLFSLYNVRYRASILLFSLFRKRIYHHALSRYAKKFLDNFYDPKKVVHITHGIQLKDYVSRNFSKNKKEILKFIYVGYLDDVHKGIKVLLKGIEIFIEKNNPNDVIFEFCGMGPLESDICALEKRFPNYIKFNGYISYDQIANFYGKSDVFLFSSRREPFPRVLMEALAARLVIICSKTIGSIELLKGKEFAFFIDKLDPKGFCEKINEVYRLWKESPEKINQLQNQAQEFVIKNYSTDIEIKMFRNLIDKVS